MNRLRIWLLLFTVIFINIVTAQNSIKRLETRVPPTVCYASGKVEKSFVPPPSNINLKSSEKKSEIIVDYSLFPQKAKDAFEYAVSIWESIIESDIPIYIHASWRSLDKNVLGSAGPADYFTNFKNIPHSNRFYPVAVVEKITKSEISDSLSPDIVATFNKDVNWYYGTDGQTPDLQYDFVTVVLHEITHGLGFTGFFSINNNKQGVYIFNEIGDAAAFDLLAVRKNNNQLVDTTIYKMPSILLGKVMVSNGLYANSPVAISVNNNQKPRLYAPSDFDEGSSIYHLNDLTYPSGNVNSLMTHAIGKGEAVHTPGPLTEGIMDDIGWRNMYLDFEKPKDIETVKPISFKMSIESDYLIDTTSLFIFYSYDNFENHKDSLPLIIENTSKLFTAELLPTIETGTIHYYLISKDTIGREFKLPTEAPKTLYTLTIGPDSEPPVINHSPIQYYLLATDNLTLTTNADDNLGIDTVFVDYEINGEPQQSFGLTLDSFTLYSGSFNFDLNILNDGDEITYSITAKDSAVAQNTTTVPDNGKFSFKVEKIFDPVGGYINDFNTSTGDFIFSDFDIYTDTSFTNPALHSPHPYPSPGVNNKTFNFSAILKQPIIIFEAGTITFDEIVLVEPGESQSVFGDGDFWDYVIVEGSKDYGKSWKQLSDGYDSKANVTWKLNYNKEIIDNVSQAVGVPEWFVNNEINLSGNENFAEGDTILIRFRLFSDPFANGWGWAIDNLRIQFPVSSPVATLSPGNIMIYPNPFNDVVNISLQANKNIDEIKIDVFNMFGQKIHSTQNKNVFGEISYKIDLGNYADGMYLISVKENRKQVFSRKIIKHNQ